MAKLLLHATCVTNPDNSFAKREVFYTTGLLQTGGVPISNENTTTITCSPFALPQGTVLEQYCALAADGTGVMRVVTATGIEATNFTHTDTPSTACDGTCNLNAPYVAGLPTSTSTSRDGIVEVDAGTSYPPITVYNPQLGSPTSNTRYTAAGVLPARYLIRYDNVPAGTYALQMQDNGNCQLTTPIVTVAAGPAPGTGTSGLGSQYNWFKYELVGDGKANGTPFTIQGYAWNKTTKQAYPVDNVAIHYPDWYEYALYARGAIVKFLDRTNFFNPTTAFYRAKMQLVKTDFPQLGNKVPAPHPFGDSNDWWERVPTFTGSIIYHRLGLIGPGSPVNEMFFYNPQPTGSPFNSWHYPKDSVVRYDWAGFYKAKADLDTRNFANGRLPAPTVGTSNQYWEQVSGYDLFFYAIPETEAIDQYMVGPLSRRVRYHVYNPEQPNYAPTATSSIPAPVFDYVLFDDTTPSVETSLGDLRVIDVIKNDVDDAGAENGSVAVLAISPSMPITYHLRNGVRPGYAQDNQTGVYENLPAGAYVVDIADADKRYTSVSFTITDNYGKRWRLLFDDLTGQPLSIFIYERNWTGGVTDVIGTGTPVMLSWDSGGDPGGYLPEAVGANLDFELITEIAQQFVDTALRDDRSHRVDYYRNDKLQFRGYLSATQYQERMLGSGQPVKLVATDGLGQLQNTQFINYFSERQSGRTSMLSVLLKCLSFCDVNLPVLVGVNLRDRLMTTDGDPLLEAFVQRNAYEKKDGKIIKAEDLIDCRTVINAILQVFNAFLFQADGCWKVIALNEVHDPFAVRAYSPAGTLLPTFDASSLPLHILAPENATGTRELFWVNAGQSRTVVASAQIIKTVVPLQLETNLFRNGDFVEWDGARPLHWAVNGTPTIARAKGEKSKEYALNFTGYTTAFVPGSYLLSPPVPHLAGQDEDGMQVKLRALLQAPTTDPAELKASVFFQVVCDGAPYGAPFEVELSTKDKWKEHAFYLPLGLPGTSVRLRVIQPQASDTASVGTTVSINSVALSIQPGLVDWSDQKEDHAEVANSDQTGIRLPDIELVHADLPRLPNAAGNPLAPKKMDVFAWRHAVTLADYSATTGWSRPVNRLAYTPLLENAAEDRMALRAVPANVITGEVKGPGIDYLRLGLMLDMPEEGDGNGRFLVISCFKNERKRTARITVRRLADGAYDGAVPDLPEFGRGARKGTKVGYRVATVNGAEQFRIAAK